MKKEDIINKLADVMFDLTDFCEGLAIKLKDISGHGLKKKVAKAEEKDFSEMMNEPETLQLFAIRSIRSGKYVTGVYEKSGKKKLDDEPTLIGPRDIMENYWCSYNCDSKYYEIVEVSIPEIPQE